MTKSGSKPSTDPATISNCQQLWPVIRRIISGTRLANTRDELRKKQKDRNDQGNGGCADRSGPSLFVRKNKKLIQIKNDSQIKKAA
jgi:hypothetical protein